MQRHAIVRLTLVLGLVLTSAWPASAQSGLVAAYSFDEGSGTMVTDASGNANTGTVSAASWTTTGKYGGALSFNGSNSWVTISHSAVLSLTNGMTLEAWVNTPTPSGWRCIILKERPGGLSYGLYGGDLTGRAAGFVRRGSDIDDRG